MSQIRITSPLAHKKIKTLIISSPYPPSHRIPISQPLIIISKDTWHINSTDYHIKDTNPRIFRHFQQFSEKHDITHIYKTSHHRKHFQQNYILYSPTSHVIQFPDNKALLDIGFDIIDESHHIILHALYITPIARQHHLTKSITCKPFIASTHKTKNAPFDWYVQYYYVSQSPVCPYNENFEPIHISRDIRDPIDIKRWSLSWLQKFYPQMCGTTHCQRKFVPMIIPHNIANSKQCKSYLSHFKSYLIKLPDVEQKPNGPWYLISENHNAPYPGWVWQGTPCSFQRDQRDMPKYKYKYSKCDYDIKVPIPMPSQSHVLSYKTWPLPYGRLGKFPYNADAKRYGMPNASCGAISFLISIAACLEIPYHNLISTYHETVPNMYDDITSISHPNLSLSQTLQKVNTSNDESLLLVWIQLYYKCQIIIWQPDVGQYYIPYHDAEQTYHIYKRVCEDGINYHYELLISYDGQSISIYDEDIEYYEDDDTTSQHPPPNIKHNMQYIRYECPHSALPIHHQNHPNGYHVVIPQSRISAKMVVYPNEHHGYMYTSFRDFVSHLFGVDIPLDAYHHYDIWKCITDKDIYLYHRMGTAKNAYRIAEFHNNPMSRKRKYDSEYHILLSDDGMLCFIMKPYVATSYKANGALILDVHVRNCLRADC